MWRAEDFAEQALEEKCLLVGGCRRQPTCACAGCRPQTGNRCLERILVACRAKPPVAADTGRLRLQPLEIGKAVAAEIAEPAVVDGDVLPRLEPSDLVVPGVDVNVAAHRAAR